MTDLEIFSGLERKENKAFLFLQKNYLDRIVRMVENNSGNAQDGNDIFQEGLVALWINVTQGKYQLQEKVKLSTYFQQICRNIWISKLRSRKNTLSISDHEYLLKDDSTDELDKGYEEIKTLQKLIAKLNDSCKKILKLFYFEKMALKQIALKLSLTEKTAKNNKYRCMQKLRTSYDQQ